MWVASTRLREELAQENLRVMQRMPQCRATASSEHGLNREGGARGLEGEIVVCQIEGIGVCMCTSWGSPWLRPRWEEAVKEGQ
jgi:hypothetical protein